MKTLVFAAALLGVSTLSATPLDRGQTPATALKPTTVVAPTDLPLGFHGAAMNVEFTLDAAGRPQDIRVPSVYDPQLKRQVVKAFSQWQFAPMDTSKHYVLVLEVKPQS